MSLCYTALWHRAWKTAHDPISHPAKEIKDGLQRKYWKFRLTKRLYERSYTKQDVLELYGFIDWILVLSEDLEKLFLQDLNAFEEEKAMQYVTSVERIGRQDGELKSKREDIIEALEINLEISAPKEVVDLINQESDIVRLKEMHRKAIKVLTLEEFQSWLKI